MQTVSDLKAAIRARGYSTDTATEQLIMLNSVQRAILGDHRWRFMLATETVPVVANDDSYTLVAVAHHIEAVSLVNTAGDRLSMRKGSLDEYDLKLDLPEGFAWVEMGPGVIQLYPAPTEAGTMTVRYVKAAPELTLDSDVPVLPGPYRDVLVAGVCRLLAMRERQPDAVAMFTAERDELMRSMRQQYGLKRQASRVVDSGTHDYSVFLRY